jgi:hypothetical protein
VTANYERSVVSGMADGPVPGYRSFWTNTRSALNSGYNSLIGQFPDADAQLKKLFKVLGDIEGVAAYTPASVGNSEQWSAIVNSAEVNRQNLCKALSGKTLFSAPYSTYTVAHELKVVLKASTVASQSERSCLSGLPPKYFMLSGTL